MTATLGELPVLQATIWMPRIGLWTAVASVDTAGTMVGTSTLVVDGLELACAVDGDQVAGRFEARLIAGAGSLSTLLPAKAYRGVPLRLPIADVLEEAGESLSATASAGLDVLLLHWCRIEAEAAAQFQLLATEAALPWRALPDGSIWFGEEAWPESTASYQILKELPGQNACLVTSESGLVLPGTAVGGRHVSRVEHQIKASQTRSTVFFEGGS